MDMTTHTARRFAKVVVAFERRDDGGLRAYSDDVPGFVLSHKDPSAVIRDIAPVLERILSAIWGVKVTASPLPHVGEIDQDDQDDPNTEESVAAYANRARDYLAHVS
jgi:hypothetical protein